MKVRDLIDILKTLDGACNIYLSGDAEGNYYGTLENESIELNKIPGRRTGFVILFPYEERLDYEELN